MRHMWFCQVLVSLIIVCWCNTALAEEHRSDWQSAVDLAQKGNHDEAKAAFLRIAAGNVSADVKTEALEQAIGIALRQNHFDEAMALSRRIPARMLSVCLQMDILLRQRKAQELIANHASEDFTQWPADMAARGLHLRGRAYVMVRDAARATADLAKAVERMPENAHYWHTLAEAQRDLNGDLVAAAAAFQRAFALTGKSVNWLALSSTIGEALVLLRQARPQDAILVLKRYDETDFEQMGVSWRRDIMRAYAHVYAALGRNRESLDLFSRANQLDAAR